MNIGHSSRPGNSLQPLADMLDTHVMNDGGPPDPVQCSPAVEVRNLRNLQFALNNVSAEDMAKLLSAYLIARFDRVRTSFIGRDIARNAETGR